MLFIVEFTISHVRGQCLLSKLIISIVNYCKGSKKPTKKPFYPPPPSFGGGGLKERINDISGTANAVTRTVELHFFSYHEPRC